MINHLSDVKKNYLEHMFFAASKSFALAKASLFLFLHAIFPNWFVDFGSFIVERKASIAFFHRRYSLWS